MYQALDTSIHEIRLLKLLPGNSAENIKVQLITTALDRQPIPYEALSYVWGRKRVPADRIVVDGTSTEVTENLYAALRRLRRSDQARVLWVDAVCINQKDILERNHQVRLMRQLYAGATRVITWLGDSLGCPHELAWPVATPDATRLSDGFRNGGRTERFQGGSIPGSGSATIELLVGGDSIHWDDERLHSTDMIHLVRWLLSDWWLRAWTVQEAAVAQSLVYMVGKAELRPESLQGLIYSFNAHHFDRQCCDVDNLDPDGALRLRSTLAQGLQRVRAVKKLGERLERQNRGGPAVSLSSVAAICRGRLATDPRDKVYAFTGLPRGFSTAWVDYSLSLESTFEAAARECIRSVKRLDVLSFCHYPPEIHLSTTFSDAVCPEGIIDLSLPSWVPNWTLRYGGPGEAAILRREELMDLLMTADAPGGWLASGAAAREALVGQQDPPGLLGVSGRCFDTVKALGAPHLNPKSGVRETSLNWRLASGVDKDPMSPYAGGGNRLDAYKRTLCMNISCHGNDKAYGTNDEAAQGIWWFNQLCGLKRAPKDRDRSNKAKAIQQCCDEAIRSCSIGRVFFISEKGYFGLAPSTAQLGDRICILAGGQVPHILREAGEAVLPDSGIVPAFKLVGDSYVHGIMHGEAMADVEEGRASLERWALI